MSAYDAAKLVHIFGVIGLFIGAGIAFAGMLRMRQVSTVEEMRGWTALASGPAKGLPLTLLFVLLPGVYMVIDLWGWDTPWMSVGLTMYLVTLPLALAINLRRLLGIHKSALTAPNGPVPALLDRQRRDPLLWTSVQTMTAIDIGTVALMTVKPALTGSLVTMAAAIIIGLAASAPLWRSEGRQRALPAAAGGRSE